MLGQRLGSLRELHGRLTEHFKLLRAARDSKGGGKPIFALEHGLNTSEVLEMQRLVRNVLGAGPPPRDAWLPIVVYAAEVGYRYSGDEYWQTFERETPGWVVHGDRYYLRDKFVQFARLFGGAKPIGRWAAHFSIICWPITHAVLPTDLQQDLARLLYDYRHQLTGELLAQPEALGVRLASRAYWTSARFQNFAQSTDLLGQVAAALLSGADDRDAHLILNSTLARIVTDLSKERLARRWLSEAKNTASKIALAGLARPLTRLGLRQSIKAGRLGPLAKPRLYMSLDPSQRWLLRAELPDFSVVPANLADFHWAISRLRCRVAGVEGPPLPSGALAYRRTVTLANLPPPNIPFLTLENGDEAVNAILADECCLDPGPRHLFKVVASERAVEVIGKVVRPGSTYLLVTPTEIDAKLPDWVTPVAISCNGFRGYRMHIPDLVGYDDQAFLAALRVGLASEIELRPVGLSAASWDGEGRAEWIAGDAALVAIASSRDVAEGVATLDGGVPVRIAWSSRNPARRAFLDLGRLETGQHELKVSILPSGSESMAVDGVLSIGVREPRPRDAHGNFREALVIRCSPAGPSLEELWDGRARLEIVGPSGLEVAVNLVLEQKRGSTLGTYRLEAPLLPITGDAWSAALERVADGPAAKRYDEATACLVDVSHPALGSARLRCSREFKALRWGVGRDREGSYAHLYDNIGARDVAVERLDFESPDIRKDFPVDFDRKIRDGRGGLFVASWQEHRAAVVIPPAVHDIADLKRAIVTPWITAGNRSPATILAWIGLCELWHSARLPGDALARIARDRALHALAASIGSVIGGHDWAARERAILSANSPDRELSAWSGSAAAMASNEYQRGVAADIQRSAREGVDRPIDERVDRFVRHLRRLIPNPGSSWSHPWLAAFLLRLASAPGQTRDWSGAAFQSAIDFAMTNPAAVRAARLYVLGVHIHSAPAPHNACYVGWDWR